MTCRLSNLISLAALVIPFSANGLGAQVAPDAQPLRLYRIQQGALDPMRQTLTGTVRSKVVVPNLDVLDSVEKQDKLVAPWFEGREFLLRFGTKEIHGPQRYSWTGTIEGLAGSQFVLTRWDGGLAAVFMPNDRSPNPLALQGAPGVHVIREMKAGRGTCGALAPTWTPLPLPPLTASIDDDPDKIMVLAIYGKSAYAQAGSHAKIQAAIVNGIALANTVCQNSGMSMRYYLVGTPEAVDYTTNTSMTNELHRLTKRADGYLDSVHYTRAIKNADLVAFIVGENRTTHGNVAGVAWRPSVAAHLTDPSIGFSVTEWKSIPSHTLAHEMGHNFGCDHDDQNATPPLLYSYAKGMKWGLSLTHTGGVTVMGYETTLSPRRPYYSTPSVRWQSQVAMGDATHDNVKCIGNSKQSIANQSQLIKPDLVTDYLALSKVAVSAGNSIRANFTVRNMGWALAQNSSAALYLSNDAVIDTTDKRIDYVTVSSLKLFEGSKEVIDFRMPNVPDGTYWIGVFADYQKRVTEMSESNNTRAIMITSKTNDRTPPTGPYNLRCISHQANVWSTVARVQVKWDPAKDTGTGLLGYAALFDQSSNTVPTKVNSGAGLTGEGRICSSSSKGWYYHIRPVDNAMNWGSTQHLGPFMIDTDAPTGKVTIQAVSRVTPLALTVTGKVPSSIVVTASDNGGSGVKAIRVKVGAQAWSGWKSQSTFPVTIPVVFSTGEGTKNIAVEVEDNLSHISPPFTDSILVDLTPPTGSVAMNPPTLKFTSKRAVEVIASFSDNIPSGVAEVAFDAGGGWSSWLAASSAHAYPLGLIGPEGIRTIRARYRDYAMNISKDSQVSIILDQTAPQGSVVLSPKPFTTSAQVSVTFSYKDLPSGTNSGVAVAQIDLGDGNWSSWMPIASLPRQVTLAGPAGLRVVRVKFGDHAGNVSAIYSDSTNLVLAPPLITSVKARSKPFQTPLVSGLTITGNNLYPPVSVKIENVLVQHVASTGALTVPISELARVVTRPGTYTLLIQTGAGVAYDCMTRTNPWPIDEGRIFKDPTKTSWAAIAESTDIDGDGTDELFVSDHATGGVIAAFSIEDAVFKPLVPNPVGSIGGRVFRMRFADLDNDGLRDLVVLSYDASKNGLRVYRNVKNAQGQHVFQLWSAKINGLGQFPADIRIDDLDGDGWQDIVLLEGSNSTPRKNYVYAYQNMGKSNSVGVFNKTTWFKNPIGFEGYPWWMGQVSWDPGPADDFLVKGEFGYVILSRNAGATPSYTDQAAAMPQGMKTSVSREFIDFDHDGYLDLIINDAAAKGVLKSYRYDPTKKVYVLLQTTTAVAGTPNGGFTVGRLRSVEKAPAILARTDLLFASVSSMGWSTRFFDVSTQGVITAIPHTNGIAPYNHDVGAPVRLKDLDGDGDDDLLSTDGVATLKLFYGMGRQLTVDGVRKSLGSLGVHYYSIPRAGAFHILMISASKTKLNVPGTGLWRLWPVTAWIAGPVVTPVEDILLNLPVIPAPMIFYLQVVEGPRFGTASGLRFSNMVEVRL